MRTIAHISDLHFGAEVSIVATGLLVDLAEIAPHVVAVSGDLTQRAHSWQFAAARDYLAQIAAPQIVVPGNHDVPLHNVFDRFFRPLARYRQFIADDLHPLFVDEELAVAGINTARSNTWKDGRVSRVQIVRVQEQFDAAGDDRFKVLVAHHPFIPPQIDPRAALVGRINEVLTMLEASGCALILAGHLHRTYCGDVRLHHVQVKRSILVAQAGTAISHRRRDEPNSYHRITLDGDRLELEVRAWNGEKFARLGATVFERSDDGWVRSS